MSHSASQADRSRPLQTPAQMEASKRRTSPPLDRGKPGSDAISLPADAAEVVTPVFVSSSRSEPSVDAEAGGSDEGDEEIPSDIIDKEIFRQILDLDDGDSKEFSYEMTAAYLIQAKETFRNMDDALKGKDLNELSRLGHYLKGSSAAVGIWRVQASCERIQHYGQLRDEEAATDLTPADALQKITQMIAQAKKENETAEAWLNTYYKDEIAAAES